jgi:hypothetical protein
MTVQYLNPITTTISQDCYIGTATITLNGGYPEFYGGNYTVSDLLPLTATFVNTTTGLGGAIGINGLQDGQIWSFTVTDDNGCPQTVSGVFVGPEDAIEVFGLTIFYRLAYSYSFPSHSNENDGMLILSVR